MIELAASEFLKVNLRAIDLVVHATDDIVSDVLIMHTIRPRNEMI